MKRTYDNETRWKIRKLLRNAIKALEADLIHDPGDLAIIAHFLERIAIDSGDDADEHTWFNDSYICGPRMDTLDLRDRLIKGIWVVVEREKPVEPDANSESAADTSKAIA